MPKNGQTRDVMQRTTGGKYTSADRFYRELYDANNCI
jgi:hypothetical protein